MTPNPYRTASVALTKPCDACGGNGSFVLKGGRIACRFCDLPNKTSVHPKMVRFFIGDVAYTFGDLVRVVVLGGIKYEGLVHRRQPEGILFLFLPAEGVFAAIRVEDVVALEVVRPS
jgi:hypothetical protein